MVQDFPSDSIVVTMTFRWTPDLLSLPHHQWSPMSINYDVDNNCSGAVVYLCGVYYNYDQSSVSSHSPGPRQVLLWQPQQGKSMVNS